MSANINYNANTNKYSFYSKKEIAWHGLGQVVQDAQISDDVIKEAQLNWEVEKCEVYCKYPINSIFKDDTGKLKRGEYVNNVKALVRMDNGVVLGSCSDRYEVLNNIDAFNFIDNIVGEKLAIYETAGALGKGEIVFVTAKLPSFIKPTNNKDDIIEKYILFTTTHDGSGSVRAMFTPIRVVCNNTLNMALANNTGRISFKHTKNVKDKISRAREVMGLYIDYDRKLTSDLARMAEKTVNKKEIETILANTFLTAEQIALYNGSGILLRTDLPKRAQNNIIYALDYIDAGPGQNYSRGTAYWLYNGITSYLGNAIEYNNDEDRMLSLIQGNSNKYAQKAYNLINDLSLI